MNLDYLPTFKELLFSGGGIVTAIWVPLGLARRKDRRARIEAEKAKAKAAAAAEQVKALELQEIKNSLKWLKEQFGESPNGNGIMQQLKQHIGETRVGFTGVSTEQIKTNLALARVEVKQAQHETWHLGAKG